MKFKVFVDGVEVSVQNDVKIIVDVDEEDQVDIHVTATPEGLVYDLVEQGETVDGLAIDWCNIVDQIRSEHDEGDIRMAAIG